MAKRSKVKVSVTRRNGAPADQAQEVVSRRRAAGVRGADLHRGLDGPWISARVVGGVSSRPEDESLS